MNKDQIDELCRRLVDGGKLLEAGWLGYRLQVLPPDAPQIQIDECRIAFFSGAQHLFSSIMGIMDADREPTEADLRRMSAIDTELTAFIAEFKKIHGMLNA